MRLTLLGTGSASGIPVYGCDCEACAASRADPKLRRGACSALLEVAGRQYLLDAGQPNLTERFVSGSLHGILLTHFHPDHVQGLFHLRWGRGLQIPIYCPPDSEGCADLYKHPGILRFRPLPAFETFSLDGVRATPLPLIHSKPTFGYLFESAGCRLAYLTDTKGLREEVLTLLIPPPLDLMVIDCSFPPGVEGEGHNNLDEALRLHEVIGPERTVLTHIGHDLHRWLMGHLRELPAAVSVGRDGQQVFPLV